MNLRVHAELLFGEHAFVLGKLAVVAAGGRKDEFHAYAGVLASNAVDVATVFKLAFGETGGQQLGDAWTAGDNFYVAYLVAAVTQDQGGAAAAMGSLNTSYVPQLVAAVTSSAGLTAAQAMQLASGQVAAVKLVVDDAVGAAYTKLFPDLVAGQTAAVAFADALARQASTRFPDRFPGNPDATAPTLRATLNVLFQRQAYLTTMLTDAVVGSAQAEVSPVAGAIAATSTAIDTHVRQIFGGASAAQLGTVWDREALQLAAYAQSGDAAVRQNVLSTAAPPMGAGATYGPDLTSAFQSVLKVVDDQRGPAYDVLAGDDRAAAVEFAVAADEITAAAVRLAPAKLT